MLPMSGEGPVLLAGEHASYITGSQEWPVLSAIEVGRGQFAVTLMINPRRRVVVRVVMKRKRSKCLTLIVIFDNVPP